MALLELKAAGERKKDRWILNDIGIPSLNKGFQSTVTYCADWLYTYVSCLQKASLLLETQYTNKQTNEQKKMKTTNYKDMSTSTKAQQILPNTSTRHEELETVRT